jgi:hypothetical protein
LIQIKERRARSGFLWREGGAAFTDPSGGQDASQFPLDKAAGHLTDKTWYDGIMAEGHGFAATGAVPDQYVIESWIGLPKSALPDSGGYTFAQSVRDFTKTLRGLNSLRSRPLTASRRRQPESRKELISSSSDVATAACTSARRGHR